MFVRNGKPIPLDQPWKDEGGNQYPANWLRLATAEEKTRLGITEEPDLPEVAPVIPLQSVADAKVNGFDAKTAEILATGFPYNGHRFSMAADAKSNLDSVMLVKDKIPYPLPWSATDNTMISLASAAEVESFYLAMVGFAMTVKTQAAVLRGQVATIMASAIPDAQKRTALEVLVDTR